MRYIHSEKSFRQYQPVKKAKPSGLFGFLKRKKKQTLVMNNRPAPVVSARTNPYRRVEEKKRGLPLSIKLVFLFIILFSWIALVIYLPYFHINKIVYFGLDIIQKEEIENYIKTSYLDDWKIWPHNSYFLSSSGEIAKLLNQKYSLNSVEVRKQFPNTLEVDLEEKISSVIYDNGEKYFLLDAQGSALKYLGETGSQMPTTTITTATSTTSSSTLLAVNTVTSHKPDYLKIKSSFGNYPIIFDTRYLPVAEKQNNILSQQIITGTIAWRDQLEKEGIGSVKYFITENPLAGLGAVTNKNITIYWQPTSDLNLQIINLKTVLRSEQPKEYVDLRFGERVYWK